MKRFAVVTLLLGLVALPLLAQNPTGTLSGRASDGQEALPGVTVTITSPSLQGSRTAVTSVDGDYIFKFLPPGEYKTRFELSGFQTTETSVKISAAVSSKVDAVMPMAQVAEEVTVTGSYETIATTSTVSTTYEKQLVDKLPVGRDVLNYVYLTPAASTNGPNAGLTISGSQSYENLIMVNGVQIQDNVRGTRLTLYIEDAIQETTTSTSAVSAEYGRFAGGVVNALTKSGGNETHGTLRLSLDAETWTESTAYTSFRSNTINNTWEATLGGFFLKDRLWYFAAGRYRKTEGSGQFGVSLEPYDTATDQKRYEGKLTFSLSADHRFVGSYMKIDTAQDGYGFATPWGVSGYDVMDPASIYSRTLPQELYAANYTGVLTDSFFLEAQYSKRMFTFIGSGGSFTDQIKGTPVGYFAGSFWGFYNSPIFCAVCEGAEEKRDNENYLVKGSLFLSTAAMGSHDLVFGYDSFNDKRLANNYQSGSQYFVYPLDTLFDPNDPFTFYPILTPGMYADTGIEYDPVLFQSKGTNFKTDSLYVNDKWRLNNNFTFNVGLRWDKNDGKDASGKTTAKDSKVSPRVAATWDPNGDGEWLVTGSYGKYVSAIANTVADSGAAGGQPAYFFYTYNGPEVNVNCDPETGAGCVATPQALQILFNWWNNLSGDQKLELLADVPSVPGLTPAIQKSLASPSADELTLGVARRFGSSGLVRIDVVNREFHDFYVSRTDLATGQIEDEFGTAYDLTVIENNDRILTRKYQGVQTQWQFRLGDRLSVGGNYTWSTLKGNVNGETGGSGPVTSGELQYPEYKEARWNNPKGYLAADQRHRARLFLVYDLFSSKHNNLTASFMQTYGSGLPYGAVATASSNRVRTTAYIDNPGYASPPTTGVNYYFTSRDRYRTEDVFSTDVAFNYGFKVPAFGTDVELFIEPKVTNVFNNQAVVVPNTTIYSGWSSGRGLTRFNPSTTAPVECTVKNDAGTVCTGSGNWMKGPSFGKATRSVDFQTPRTFTVSMGVRF